MSDNDVTVRHSHVRLWEDCVASVRLWRVAWFLGMQDVRARFRRSHIGPLWILINLAFWVGGVGVVYGFMFGQPAAEFLPQLMAGFVIWGYISATMIDASHSFINAQGYITQFAFPKQIHILRNWFGHGLVFGIGLSALIVVLVFLGQFKWLGILISMPGLALLLLAGLGHNAALAYVGARYRDLPHAMGGALQVIFLVTPIVFPISTLKSKGLDWVYQFNPMHYMIDIVRHPLMTGQWASGASYLGAIGYILFLWCLTVIVIRKMDRKLVFLL
ncbi:hypothetical protein [Vibrio fluvialis]|uniref:ABC transporter permease n=1 Tax=Vibrio fluvialis TaxID=676 RepID=UPI00301C7966